ncbi:unnamed protein product, partial [Darwinula stevensoni]
LLCIRSLPPPSLIRTYLSPVKSFQLGKRGGEDVPFNVAIRSAARQGHESPTARGRPGSDAKALRLHPTGGHTYALKALKKKLHDKNPHVHLFSLQVLESWMKNCGGPIHEEVATRAFMDELQELFHDSNNEKVRSKILELVQVWAYAFRNEPRYKIFQDRVFALKAQGLSFPTLKESDAMFSSSTAPEACGQIFCAPCSSNQAILPKFGFEKEVRICDTKSEAELKEEEDLHLALALSQSEAESKEQRIEIFVNRMRANECRGRHIGNDSFVQTLFLDITLLYSRLVRAMEEEERKRYHYEGLQDRLSQIRDARAALDAQREDRRERQRREAEEAQRLRQIQMAQKLEIMRKKKQEYLDIVPAADGDAANAGAGARDADKTRAAKTGVRYGTGADARSLPSVSRPIRLPRPT